MDQPDVSFTAPYSFINALAPEAEVLLGSLQTWVVCDLRGPGCHLGIHTGHTSRCLWCYILLWCQWTHYLTLVLYKWIVQKLHVWSLKHIFHSVNRMGISVRPRAKLTFSRDVWSGIIWEEIPECLLVSIKIFYFIYKWLQSGRTLTSHWYLTTLDVNWWRKRKYIGGTWNTTPDCK